MPRGRDNQRSPIFTENCGPGDPGEDHWAHSLYLRYARYIKNQRSLAQTTTRNYLSDLATFWTFLDSYDIHEIQSVDRTILRRYLHWLLTEAKRVTIAGRVRTSSYASRSVSRRRSALRVFFRFLTKHISGFTDPTAQLGAVKLDRRLPDFLDTPDAFALVQAPPYDKVNGLRDRAILELLYAAGLRVSELIGLNVNNVDLNQRQLRAFGKGNKERLIPIGKPACEAVDHYLRQGRPALLKHRDDGALFLNRFGNRLSQRSVQMLVRSYAALAGIESKVHPHTLRHTFATHLLDGGADLRVVQELLGHANPAVTQIYTHLTPSLSRRAYITAHPRARPSPVSIESEEDSTVQVEDKTP